MPKLILSLLLVAGTILLVWGAGQWLSDMAKEASGRIISFILRFGSRFEDELTSEGEAEQRMWREQRLRDLRNRKMRGRLQ